MEVLYEGSIVVINDGQTLMKVLDKSSTVGRH